MSDYFLLIYEGDTEPSHAKNQLYFRFSEDRQESMLTFIDMVLDHSKDKVHILITS